MKKIYLLIIFVFLAALVSCDKEEEEEKGISFSPPSWIIGTWNASGGGTTISYTFTSDDVLNNGVSLKVTLSGSTITEDTKTVTVYQFTVTSVVNGVYLFEKQSETTLNYTIAGFGPVLLTKQN